MRCPERESAFLSIFAKDSTFIETGVPAVVYSRNSNKQGFKQKGEEITCDAIL